VSTEVNARTTYRTCVVRTRHVCHIYMLDVYVYKCSIRATEGTCVCCVKKGRTDDGRTTQKSNTFGFLRQATETEILCSSQAQVKSVNCVVCGQPLVCCNNLQRLQHRSTVRKQHNHQCDSMTPLTDGRTYRCQ
jgi:hypothetical protein